MTKEEAKNYLKSTGMSDEQIRTIVDAFTCKDCISRKELLKAIDTWDKFGCDADTKLVPYQDHYIPYIHYDDVIKCIKGMPPIQPKQEPCEYAPFTIDELEDEDTQKLLRGFKNQRVIVTDHDCSPSVTIIEPCEDCISRQEVLDIVRFENKWLFDARSTNVDTDIAFNGIISKVSDLPPVQPKIKTGHWILTDDDFVYCSECEDSYYPRPIDADWYYCPHCGAEWRVRDKCKSF